MIRPTSSRGLVSAVHGPGHAAVPEHGHAIGDLPDLVQVVGDEQHARAAGAISRG